MSRIILRSAHDQFETEEAEHHANGQATCVAHKNLPSVLGVSKNIIIEERYQYSQCSERQHGIYILMKHEKVRP